MAASFTKKGPGREPARSTPGLRAARAERVPEIKPVTIKKSRARLYPHASARK